MQLPNPSEKCVENTLLILFIFLISSWTFILNFGNYTYFVIGCGLMINQEIWILVFVDGTVRLF